MQRIQAEAAIAADIFHLMESVPSLAQVMRYGNVRSFDAAILLPIVTGLITRICISLPVACGSLDEAAATLMDEQLVAVNGAVGLIQIPDLTETWQATLKRLTAQNQLAGLVAGRCCRLLMDAGVMTPDEVAQRFSLALSTANDPTQAAAWVSGLLRGSGLVLLHNTALWQIMDDWVSGLNGDAFQHVLPLLRRTFSEFPAAERRQMGQQVSQGRGGKTIAHTPALAVNPDRANQVLPILQRLLGAN
jgi:hypothetical protein